jgi:2-polyprenyl-3-methyl-5-hydroxy-6-metoxy-1,4-benzoquinol methylase
MSGVDTVSKRIAVETETTAGLLRAERERIHYNELAKRSSEASLIMPAWNIQRYDHPPEDTAFPLEYAFYLLGDLPGKTVVDLGCGEGLNTVILASLGARVLSVDISDESLELTGKRAVANGVADHVTLLHSDAAEMPVEASSADAVLCAAILHHVEPVETARRIRRVLKPGGVAVFEEPMAGPRALAAVKGFLPLSEGVTPDERPLTLQEVEAVCHAVGRAGRRRAFGLTTRLVCRVGARTFSPPARAAQRLDAIVLRHFPFISKFASPLVWEARKES